MRFLAIQDNRRKLPVHVSALTGPTSHLVERFQRNLARITPGGLNGVTYRVIEARDIISAMAETAKDPAFD